MKGFVITAATGISLGAGMLALNGCARYRDVVDPCYPDRYNFVARHTTREVFNTQANNGHILDQTVWNWHFETDKDGNGTANLNSAGLQHLDYLVRRRPSPDTRIYLQTAQDLRDIQKNTPDKTAQVRGDLDGRRIQSIKNYLDNQMVGKTPLNFEVAVHDPHPAGMRLTPYSGTQQWDARGVIPSLYNNFGASIGNGGVAGGAGGGGAGGGAGGGGGGGAGGGGGGN